MNLSASSSQLDNGATNDLSSYGKRKILSDFLSLSNQSVDEDLPLVEQGLDSVSAVGLQALIRKRFQIDIPLVDLFDRTSLSGLVERVLVLKENRAHDNKGNQKDDSNETVSGNGLQSIHPRAGILTPVQTMYWVGSQKDYPLGGFSTRFYAEFELPTAGDIGEFLKSLQDSWNLLVRRHEMLRATVDRNARLVVHEETVVQRLPVNERNQLERTRDRLMNSNPDHSRWPVHEIEITVVDEQKVIIHCGFEVLLIDYIGIQRLLNDWALALNAELPTTPAGSFVEKTEQLGAVVEKDVQFWKSRACQLPPGPLPKEIVASAAEKAAESPEFIRYQSLIPAAKWQLFTNLCASNCVSPSGALFAVVGCALRAAGAPERFALATTFFSVEALGSAPIGDYTRTGIVSVPHGAKPFKQQTIEATRILLEALDHSSLSSAEILRFRRSDSDKEPSSLPEYPVVFTSALGHSELKTAWRGRMTFGVSRTPQVILDMLHWEDENQLVMAWDCMKGVLTEGYVERAQAIDPNLRVEVFTRHLAGLAQLHARALPAIPVLLVVAKDQSPANSGIGMGGDDARGDNLPEDTKILSVPGHHYSILKSPTLELVARGVETFLSEIGK